VETACFVDGIGRRLRTTDPTGDEVETLRLCRELSEAASTEAALIERAGRLAAFTHPSFAQVRRVERLRGPLGGLAVVSAAVPGIRLSEVLRHAHRKWVAPDLDAARCLIEQIAGAVADFHRHSRDLAHGAIGPERIVVRPDGRAVIVEHVLGPALQQLEMGRTPLWTQFRIPAPAIAGTARFDQMSDVMQLGVLAIALVIGRPIRRDEYPHRLQDLLAEACTSDPLGERPTVSRALRSWILRTFQFEPRSSFRTAAEAATAFEAVLADEPRHTVSLASVVNYLAVCAPGFEAEPSSPSVLSAPATADIGPLAAGAGEFAVGTITATERFATVRVFRSAISGAEPLPSMVVAEMARRQREAPAERAVHVPPKAEAPGMRRLSRVATDAARASMGFARKLDWSAVRRSARVTTLSLVLVALYGVTYLGARGYLGLPSLIGGRGSLVVESRPAGIDLYVDGFPSGRTPATLDLRAGEHTLVLRTGKGITLVPVVVVAGARRIEFVEVRQRRLAPRAQTVADPRTLPAPRLPR
jgi:hypothetical protein